MHDEAHYLAVRNVAQVLVVLKAQLLQVGHVCARLLLAVGDDEYAAIRIFFERLVLPQVLLEGVALAHIHRRVDAHDFDSLFELDVEHGLAFCGLEEVARRLLLQRDISGMREILERLVSRFFGVDFRVIFGQQLAHHLRKLAVICPASPRLNGAQQVPILWHDGAGCVVHEDDAPACRSWEALPNWLQLVAAPEIVLCAVVGRWLHALIVRQHDGEEQPVLACHFLERRLKVGSRGAAPDPDRVASLLQPLQRLDARAQLIFFDYLRLASARAVRSINIAEITERAIEFEED
jgi:hypothetical protein